MEEIKIFMNRFLQAELEARIAEEDPNGIDVFNAKLNVMHSFVTEDLIGYFGMINLTEPEDPFFYEFRNENQRVREFYLIRKYEYESYGYIYRCYLSIYNPMVNEKSYYNSFFIRKIGEEFKIFSVIYYKDDISEWNHYRGERVLLALGTPKDKLSIMPPENCESCMRDYMK